MVRNLISDKLISKSDVKGQKKLGQTSERQDICEVVEKAV